MPYSFGYGYAPVDVPELDAFITDIRSVCERHGIALALEGGYEEGPKLILVPFTDWDEDVIKHHTEDYQSGIPFMDRAKAEWEANKHAYLMEQERIRQDTLSKSRVVREAEMKRKGVTLSDGNYRLVKET